MAQGIRFCRKFLHVARVKNLRQCENRVRFSHGRKFFDLRNVQKSGIQIPLAIAYWTEPVEGSDLSGSSSIGMVSKKLAWKQTGGEIGMHARLEAR